MTYKRRLFPILAGIPLLTALSYAGGYKIPENSVNSTALSAAYIANAHGADAAYHNPAAMVFNENRNLLEGNLTYIYLSEIDFDGAMDYSSEHQHFFIPSFHYSSPALGNARFGLSVVTPAGLTKRWEHPLPASTAQKFSLKTVEINPSAAYKFNEQFSAALGLRAIYSDGVVRSTLAPPLGPTASREMNGDSWDYGYNLALLFKPADTLDLAMTYRSNIDLSVEGDATLNVDAGWAGSPPVVTGTIVPYNGFASVSVPVPATLAIAAAWDITPQTTIELVIERNYWSEYEQLDFNYGAKVHPLVDAVFGAPLAKNYKDANAFRLGLTHKYSKQWTAMAGYAYDETPVPEGTLGYELPDSDAHIFSVGGRYKMSDDMSIGAALLYDYKQSRTVNNGSIAGEFSNASALLATLGIEVAL